MDNKIYIKDLFESILDYRKILFLKFLVENHVHKLQEG